jgi:N-acetylglucosaminyldiphosphoundecaprenol N-acetyl-beta-D-mannosaminyltransferase
MIDAYKKDHRSRLVATVNVDFVVNTLSWSLKQSRHPELLDILRRADLVTPDGMPIVWASKLLGVPLKGRVTGADLVPRLAMEAAGRQKSIYFLGGRGDVGRKAAELLKKRYPNLKVAETDSPFVHVEGEALSGAEEQDQAIVERINRSGADILLIGFGNPKQEIWFDRNRTRLKVPVSIGIGGTYEFIVGSVARAPLWMQKTGLEWVFRITQDPWRLWKRYFVGFFKFGLMILPAVLYYRFKRLLFNLFHKKVSTPDSQASFSGESSAAALTLIPVPNPLDASVVETVREELEKKVSQHSNIVLDFSQVDFIDSSGLGLLISLWRKADKKRKALFMIGVKSSTRRFFELSRIFDLFKNRIFDTLSEATYFIKKNADLPGFYFFNIIRPEDVIFHLFGALDAAQMAALDVKNVIKEIGYKDCIFNLKNLTFIDSSGIMFFLKIQKHVSKQGKTCIISNLTDNVLQMFRITKLNRLFTIAEDTLAAEKILADIRTSRKNA